MILRIWTIRIDPAQESAYLTYTRTRSQAMFLAQDGCLGVFFLRHADGRHAACSLWRDAAAVDALGQSALYRQTVADLAATGVLVGEPTIDQFAVTGGVVVDALAAALRDVGRTAAGPDGG